MKKQKSLLASMLLLGGTLLPHHGYSQSLYEFKPEDISVKCPPSNSTLFSFWNVLNEFAGEIPGLNQIPKVWILTSKVANKELADGVGCSLSMANIVNASSVIAKYEISQKELTNIVNKSNGLFDLLTGPLSSSQDPAFLYSLLTALHQLEGEASEVGTFAVFPSLMLISVAKLQCYQTLLNIQANSLDDVNGTNSEKFFLASTAMIEAVEHTKKRIQAISNKFEEHVNKTTLWIGTESQGGLNLFYQSYIIYPNGEKHRDINLGSGYQRCPYGLEISDLDKPGAHILSRVKQKMRDDFRTTFYDATMAKINDFSVRAQDRLNFRNKLHGMGNPIVLSSSYGSLDAATDGLGHTFLRVPKNRTDPINFYLVSDYHAPLNRFQRIEGVGFTINASQDTNLKIRLVGSVPNQSREIHVTEGKGHYYVNFRRDGNSEPAYVGRSLSITSDRAAEQYDIHSLYVFEADIASQIKTVFQSNPTLSLDKYFAIDPDFAKKRYTDWTRSASVSVPDADGYAKWIGFFDRVTRVGAVQLTTGEIPHVTPRPFPLRPNLTDTRYKLELLNQDGVVVDSLTSDNLVGGQNNIITWSVMNRARFSHRIRVTCVTPNRYLRIANLQILAVRDSAYLTEAEATKLY
ncbi:MAG: hypothetical protein NTU80_12905 [Verrucomicrobia bacterium]|nr:hypothetical protein [Verrucomicrobiota bacterium]